MRKQTWLFSNSTYEALNRRAQSCLSPALAGGQNFSCAPAKTCSLQVRYRILDLSEVALFLACNWTLSASQPFTLKRTREVFPTSMLTIIIINWHLTVKPLSAQDKSVVWGQKLPKARDFAVFKEI